jgi:hypothetical protein
MRPPVKSIAADAWQVRERIPPRTWRESTVERRVERGDHGHAYPECCLDALERGTVVKRSKAAELTRCAMASGSSGRLSSAFVTAARYPRLISTVPPASG